MKLWKAGDWTRWVKRQDVDPAILELLRTDGKDRSPEDEFLAAFLSSLGGSLESWRMEWEDEPYYWGTAFWSSGDRSLVVELPREPLRVPRFEGPGLSIEAVEAGEPRTFYVYKAADLSDVKAFVRGD